MNELHLFAGAGGGILGGMLLGHTCVCAVEINDHCRSVLLQRQRDGILPRFPIWDDITTFDANPWRGRVDVVCGGFPCQDISTAGPGAGLDGDRSGLWFEMLRVIGETLPRYVFIENSPALTSRGGVRVVTDLAKLGYSVRWGVIGASAAGLPHHRARIWMVAYREEVYGETRDLLEKGRLSPQGEYRRLPRTEIAPNWRTANQGTERVSIFRHPDDGLAPEVGELEALGNGQVPWVAATAFRILTQHDPEHGTLVDDRPKKVVDSGSALSRSEE